MNELLLLIVGVPMVIWGLVVLTGMVRLSIDDHKIRKEEIRKCKENPGYYSSYLHSEMYH